MFFRPLKLGQVLHKVSIEVDEEGTKAAASTGAELVPLSFPPQENFHVNHPFLYFIRDNR